MEDCEIIFNYLKAVQGIGSPLTIRKDSLLSTQLVFDPHSTIAVPVFDQYLTGVAPASV